MGHSKSGRRGSEYLAAPRPFQFTRPSTSKTGAGVGILTNVDPSVRYSNITYGIPVLRSVNKGPPRLSSSLPLLIV